MPNRSAGRNLRPITLTFGAWGSIVATLVFLALIVWLAQLRIFG